MTSPKIIKIFLSKGFAYEKIESITGINKGKIIKIRYNQKSLDLSEHIKLNKLVNQNTKILGELDIEDDNWVVDDSCNDMLKAELKTIELLVDTLCAQDEIHGNKIH